MNSDINLVIDKISNFIKIIVHSNFIYHGLPDDKSLAITEMCKMVA